MLQRKPAVLLRRCLLALLEKLKQIGVDLVCVRRRHAMREAWIHLQLGTLNNLCRHSTRRIDRHDLIVVAVHDKRRYVELLR